jgi:hypothetical protein
MCLQLVSLSACYHVIGKPYAKKRSTGTEACLGAGNSTHNSNNQKQIRNCAMQVNVLRMLLRKDIGFRIQGIAASEVYLGQLR